MALSQILRHEASVIWDVRSEAPGVYDALETGDRQFVDAWTHDYAQDIPYSRSYKPFEGDDYFRPWSHARSLYTVVPGTSHTLCLKGTEACCPDLAVELAHGTKKDMYHKYVNQIEWWLRIEQKAPFVFTVREGLDEAMLAARVQNDYLRRHKRFARLPIPVRVYRFPTILQRQYVETLKSFCTPQIRELADFVVGSGLSVYVYLYQGPVDRINTIWAPSASGDTGYAGRRNEIAAITAKFDFEQCIDGWLRLCVELLALGWMPTTYNSDVTGQCVRHVNAFLNGGFGDLDSIRPIATITTDQDFYKSFWFMVAELVADVNMAMIGHTDYSTGMWASHYYPSPNFGMAMVTSFVWERFRKFIYEEKRAGAVFDDRIEMIASGKSPFEKLHRIESAIFPPVADDRPFTVGDGGTQHRYL